MVMKSKSVVLKISGYEEKTGRSGQVGDVQRVHMYIRNKDRIIRRVFIPHCNVPPSLFYKSKDESLVKMLPILSLGGYTT